MLDTQHPNLINFFPFLFLLAAVEGKRMEKQENSALYRVTDALGIITKF